MFITRKRILELESEVEMLLEPTTLEPYNIESDFTITKVIYLKGLYEQLQKLYAEELNTLHPFEISNRQNDDLNNHCIM
jgi:hypothetical protein